MRKSGAVLQVNRQQQKKGVGGKKMKGTEEETAVTEVLQVFFSSIFTDNISSHVSQLPVSSDRI